MQSTSSNQSVFEPLFTKILVLSMSIFLSHTAWSQDINQVINTKRSVYCGVETCETKPVYKTCANAACGEVKSTEDCGQHWGAWRRIGSGHDDPCLNIGCHKIGGAIAYDYGSSRHLIPQPQEKTKYRCVRDVVSVNTCQNEACGIERIKQNGNIESYLECVHPIHGLNDDVWNMQYKASQSGVTKNETKGGNTQETATEKNETKVGGTQAMLELVQVLAKQGESIPEAKSTESSYNRAVLMTMEYLKIAAVFPDDHAKRLVGIKNLFEKLKGSTSPDSLRSALGDAGYIALSQRLPVLTYTCQAQ